MSFNGSLLAFSSEDDYKKILSRKLQLLSKYNELLFERMQNEYFFIQGNPIFDYILHEIYPKFTEIYNPNFFQLNVFNELSQYANNKIRIEFDEKSALYFNQIRDLFIFLSSFQKYPSIIKNPLTIPLFSHQLSDVCSILYEKMNDKQVYLDFLPFCAAQNFINISYDWSKWSTFFNQILSEEADLIIKNDELKLIYSSIEPELCLGNPEFNECIQNSKDYLKMNKSISADLFQLFTQGSDIFQDFKRDFHNLEQLLEKHTNILIQILPIESALKILEDEGFTLFQSHPKIKMNESILAIPTHSSYLYSEMIRKINIQINSLKKDFDERCQFETYVLDKYRSDNNDTEFHKEIYLMFKNAVDKFNSIIENIDTFDVTIPSIRSLSQIFSDTEQYNSLLSNYMGVEHSNRKIECLNSIIDKKKDEIDEIQNEIDKNEKIIDSLEKNLAIFNDYKESVLNCELCKTNRVYVLTNCGHTFCDSCYQQFCLLEPDNIVCPFCETPFTFESIVKISWSSKSKVSDDDDDDDD